ncbi:MAG TPA: stage II sporulation protein M, partial [Sphingomicrobium sp.]
MNASLAASRDTPLVNATRFRQAHEEDWARLEQIVTRMEKRSIRSLSDDDLLELPALYRTTLSSLSVARDTSLDRALITYLERL